MIDWSQVHQLLAPSGAVIVLPTDTVYGLVGRAKDEAAVNRLYALKDRHNKPGTLIAASVDQLVELGLKRRYLTAVADYWPGAVSIVIPTLDSHLRYLTQDLPGLAVRIPDDLALRQLMEQTGPLLTSSANLPGQPPATNLNEAKQYFGDKVDAYIDGGDISGRAPSTVIRVVDDAVEILRQGAVTIRS